MIMSRQTFPREIFQHRKDADLVHSVFDAVQPFERRHLEKIAELVIQFGENIVRLVIFHKIFELRFHRLRLFHQ